MKRLTILSALIIPLLCCTSWGFYAHRKINQLAIYTLPPPMIGFYKQAQQHLTEHAVDPDKRRYIDTLEAPRHYLDAENYEDSMDSIPEKYTDALAKYGPAKLHENGIVPWQVQRTYYSLVNAFKNHDSLKILKYSAELGHYVGDAHVPLHTTRNHNGQLTDQVGIHAFWESRIPELFGHSYDYLVGRASYINNPLKEAWKIVRHSHSLLDTVLLFEAKLGRSFRADQKFSYAKKGNVMTKQYAETYAKAYQDAMNGMVEKQMRRAILSIGSYWYSAWVDAGQPALKNLVQLPAPPEDKRLEDLTEKKYQMGKIIGREN